MNYATIKYCDIANGTGVRTSLFVSGCRRHCPECFNAVAWDFGYGLPFDKAVRNEILGSLAPDYIDGLSLLGGEPFEPENQRALVPFLHEVRVLYPHKTIWCYTGTVLCILSAIPLFVAMMVNSGIVINAAVCVLLVLVACGVFAFVLGGTYYGATEKLLEEGDYTRHSKATRELRTAISVVYWLVVTAAFLLYTFGPKGNGQPQYSWFIWAVAGVLFGAVMLVVKLIARRK